jgi:hypothetical protein
MSEQQITREMLAELTGEPLAEAKRTWARQEAERMRNDPQFKRDPEVLAVEEASRKRASDAAIAHFDEVQQ